MLEIKGQVLHRVLLHVSVPDWLSDLTALLTRKFLLNEMRGDRENMCLVSGSLQTFLKFFRMTFLIACRPGFCGWWVRVNGILLVSSFCNFCSAVSRVGNHQFAQHKSRLNIFYSSQS